MRKKVPAILALSCLLLAGCAGAPTVYKEVVPDSTGRGMAAETVTVHISNDLSGNIEVIRLTKVGDPEDIVYLVRISYGGPNRRFMSGPITLTIAQREVELETETDGIRQTLQGRVPPEYVQDLFAADVVSIQYWGQPVRLTPAEIEALRALKGKQP